jgi:ferredoxin
MIFARHCPAALALLAQCAWAQRPDAQEAGDYPAKPIRVVVPSSPGGGIDALARVITYFIVERKKIIKTDTCITCERCGGRDRMSDFFRHDNDSIVFWLLRQVRQGGERDNFLDVPTAQEPSRP